LSLTHSLLADSLLATHFTMTNSAHPCLLYLCIFLLMILSFYLIRNFLNFRQKIIGKRNYPLVKAFSVLIVAFTLQNGLGEVLLPVAMDLMGYENYTYSGSPNESIIFYLVVGAIAITYIFMIKGE